MAITWTRSESWQAWAELSEGCYLLRTNLVDVDACTLWKRYIQLTDAEWAFRIHKDELAIRPIWHHKGDRVQAHILVCFLAYALWKTLAQWMQRSGLGDAPRTLLDELAKIKSGDVVLPTQSVDGRPGRAGSATLRHNTRRGPESTAQSAGSHSAHAAAPARRADKNVVKTFAQNRT